MQKFEVAREQLITALDLFLHDKSPVSVHSLAGNAREIIEEESRKLQIKPFEDEIKERFPEMGNKIYSNVINQYRNAFKHNNSDDAEVLSSFNDNHNDHMLYIVIENYVRLTKKMTPEMQIFQLWYISTYKDKLNSVWETRNANFDSYFKHILEKDRTTQKKFMLIELENMQNDIDFINDSRTEVA